MFLIGKGSYMIHDETGKENYSYYSFVSSPGNAHIHARGKPADYNQDSREYVHQSISRVITVFNGKLVESDFRLLSVKDILC